MSANNSIECLLMSQFWLIYCFFTSHSRRVPAACKCVASHPTCRWTRRFPTVQQWSPPTAMPCMQLVQTQRIWISPRCHRRHPTQRRASITRQTTRKSVRRKTNAPAASWSFLLRKSWSLITIPTKVAVQRIASSHPNIRHLLTCRRTTRHSKNTSQHRRAFISSSLIVIRIFSHNIHCCIIRIN